MLSAILTLILVSSSACISKLNSHRIQISPKLIAEIDNLLLEYYLPPERLSNALEDFERLGCEDEWVRQNKSIELARERITQILHDEPNLIQDLERLETAQGYRILVRLEEENLIQPQRDRNLESTLQNNIEIQDITETVYEYNALKKNDWYALVKKYPYYDNDVDPDVKTFVKVNAALKEAALEGSGRAADFLGLRTQEPVLEQLGLQGNIVVGGDRTAAQWYCLSARLGNPDGQENCASNSSGIEALRWLTKAAEAGHHIANYDLANNYLNGSNGVTRDFYQAKKYYCRAIYFGNQWSAQALRDVKAFEDNQKKVSPISKANMVILQVLPGNGQFDNMTYAEYQSVVEIIPLKELSAIEVKPNINYCNGLCFVDIKLFNPQGKNIGSVYWQGTELPKAYGAFKTAVLLSPSQHYRLAINVRSSMSIGIATTGPLPKTTEAKIRVIDATMKERGPLAFQLLQP